MEGLLLAKKVGYAKLPAAVGVGFERGWIIMTISESHIANLRFDLVVCNHLDSPPLVASF